MSNVLNPMAKDQEYMHQGKSEQGKSEQGKSDGQSGFGDTIMKQAESAGQYVSDQAGKMASSAMSSAENAGKYMNQRVEDARHSIGSGIKSMGESIKSSAPEGMMHDACCSFGDSITSTGQYLDEHGFSAMTEDLTTAIKRNPLPAVFIAAGLGFLLARACTSSRSSY